MNDMLVGFLLAVAGVLIGGLATHFLSKDLARRNEFNQASKEFISAFQKELARLRVDSASIYDIIYPARIRHMEASHIFRRHLKCDDLKRFRQAWSEYYVLTPSNQISKDKHEDKDEDRILLTEKIEKLFEFAKYK